MGLFGGKKRKNEQVNNEKEILNINKEIGYSYKKLCEKSEAELAATIGEMMTVHSKEYMQQILAIAKNQNNYKLAQVLQEQYTEYDNHQLEEEKNKLQEKFDGLHGKLYGGGYSGDVYDMQRCFSDLEKKCSDLGMYELAEKCHKVVNDIQQRGRNMLFEIRKVLLNNGKKWWEE